MSAKYKIIYSFKLYFNPYDIEVYTKLLSRRKFEKNIKKLIKNYLLEHHDEIQDYESQVIKFENIELNYVQGKNSVQDAFIVNINSKIKSQNIEKIIDKISFECMDKINNKFPSVKVTSGKIKNKKRN